MQCLATEPHEVDRHRVSFERSFDVWPKASWSGQRGSDERASPLPSYDQEVMEP